MGTHVQDTHGVREEEMDIGEVQGGWLGTADVAPDDDAFDLEHLSNDGASDGASFGASAGASAQVSPQILRRAAQQNAGRDISPSGFIDSIQLGSFGLPPRRDPSYLDQYGMSKLDQIAERAKRAVWAPPPPPPPPLPFSSSIPLSFPLPLPLPLLTSSSLTSSLTSSLPLKRTMIPAVAPAKRPRILPAGEIGMPTSVPGVDYTSTGMIFKKTRNINSSGPEGWFDFPSGTYTSVLLTGTTPPPSPPNQENAQI